MASKEYHDYILSEAWRQKRLQRLAISRFSCAACGAKQNVEVHHLTYARLFNEEMQDLLPLCSLHHEAAEELIDRKIIPRTGNVLHLAAETIRLVCPQPNEKKKHKKAILQGGGVKVETRNFVQDELLAEQWFQEALKLPRNAFKSLIRKRFRGAMRGKLMANGFTLYDRIARLQRKAA